jgi:hypothetical protein
MMLEIVRDRTATGVTRGFERLLYCDVESKWKNCHIIIFLESLFPKPDTKQEDALCGELALEKAIDLS